MNRSTPPQLNEGDLLAYLDGDASPELIRTIEQDAMLLAQVDELRQAQMLFGFSLAQRHCPDTDSLVEYQASLLPESERQSIADHLITCTYCQAEMAELSVGIVLDEVEVEAVEPVREPNWLDALQAAGRQLIELTMRPQLSRGPVYALRGKAQQTIFEADGFQLIVSTKRISGENTKIEGQVMNLLDPFAMDGGTITLRVGDEIQSSSPVDEFGHFELTCELVTAYSLQIDVGESATLVAVIESD